MKQVYEVRYYTRGPHDRLIPHKELWYAESPQHAIKRLKDSLRKQRPAESSYAINCLNAVAYPWKPGPI